jgi:hypothetical protein
MPALDQAAKSNAVVYTVRWTSKDNLNSPRSNILMFATAPKALEYACGCLKLGATDILVRDEEGNLVAVIAFCQGRAITLLSNLDTTQARERRPMPARAPVARVNFPPATSWQ